jgi:hypothetical protein
MPLFTASVRIIAPMTVMLVLELPIYIDDGLIKVNVLAAQAERFILPQAEREAD